MRLETHTAPSMVSDGVSGEDFNNIKIKKVIKTKERTKFNA